MNRKEPLDGFRAMLASKACVYPASAFDPISAPIAADLGYEIGAFSDAVAPSLARRARFGSADLVGIRRSGPAH